MWKVFIRPSCVLLVLCAAAMFIAQVIGRVMPSQEIAYLASDYSNSWLYMSDINHGIGYRIANAPATEGDFAWSADGTRIVFISYIGDSSEIFVASAGGTSLRQLTIGAAIEANPTWSPDGEQIVFSRQPRSLEEFPELVIMDVDSRQERVLTSSLEIETHPVWSPSGQHIAFIAYDLSRSFIKVVDAQTGQSISIMNELSGNFDHLSWSPDSTQLIFTVYNNTAVIYVMDIADSRIYRLTNPANNNYLPQWSPDGTRLVFVSERNLSAEIFVMNSDGNNQQRLAYAPQTMYYFPAWSPDGGHIAFAAASSTENAIYMINANGSNLQRIISSPLSEWRPHWRP